MEEWRQIPPYPDYEVSESGKVRRFTHARMRLAKTPLRQRKDRYGYFTVSIRPRSRVRSKPRLVHRLVAFAFLPPPDSNQKFQAQHIDGDKENNDWRNLKWGTPADNSRDMIAHGNQISRPGEHSPQAKLTAESVVRMRKLRRQGWRLSDLADEFQVCFQNVSLIINRKTWTHVP